MDRDRDRDRDHDDLNCGMASRFQSLDEVIGQVRYNTAKSLVNSPLAKYDHVIAQKMEGQLERHPAGAMKNLPPAAVGLCLPPCLLSILFFTANNLHLHT